MDGQWDIYDNISPIDYRYWKQKVAEYLSERAFIKYKLLVELALITVLCRWKICPPEAVDQVKSACDKVTAPDVYAEEKRIGHDIRALVNCIRKWIADTIKRFVHMTATSFDISDTANAARYRDVVMNVLVPSLVKLEQVLMTLALETANVRQIGRTHGQHANPITFGFAITSYVSRLGECIEMLKDRAKALRGKFSGAVGAYNASGLFFDDPEQFETEVLAEMDLLPAECSTQVVPPEGLIRLMTEVTIAAGIMANLSDDMRHLQRSEIGEIGEEFQSDQVGSSTMPQKQNPINFENVKSCWKIVVARIITVFMDQISEHQRDLTNSASARINGETIAYVVAMADRLSNTMAKMRVNKGNMDRNLAMSRNLGAAEPLYIILSYLGHPDAHEKVRQLTLIAQQNRSTLEAVALADPEVEPYFKDMTQHQRSIISDPTQYIGIAPDKAGKVCRNWQKRLLA
ncbi:MAG: lyase family protein [Patescibacteria group bacterium]|jgi:adenylosuccinate lyase